MFAGPVLTGVIDGNCYLIGLWSVLFEDLDILEHDVEHERVVRCCL